MSASTGYTVPTTLPPQNQATPQPPGPRSPRPTGLGCSFHPDLGEGGPRPGLRPLLTAVCGIPTRPQDDSDGSIECVNEERRLHKKVCNVSYPFFRAKAKVEAGGCSGVGPGRVLGGTREAREMEASRGHDWEGQRDLTAAFKNIRFSSHE